MTQIRNRIAARLRVLANRLDPPPATSTTFHFNGVPMNNVSSAATVRITQTPGPRH